MRHSRRTFLKLAGGGMALGTAGAVAAFSGLAGKTEPTATPREAMYYRHLAGGEVQCTLCPRECVVPKGARGACRVRENRGGAYYTLVHNQVCAQNVDPIEKKPLFHHLPGTTALSIATAGCNFRCRFCQNWNISQMQPEEVEHQPTSPAKLVAAARAQGAASIAFTYNEPIIFYEMMRETAAAAREARLGAVPISNGYIQSAPLKDLAPHLSAYKVDFKAFTDDFYRRTCGGALKPVLDTLVLIKSLGLWLEMVNLVIPTLNDTPEEIQAMSAWVRKELGPDVPLHFTRFQPTYQMKNLPPTPEKTLERCRDLARAEGLHFVYLGNVPGHEGENTYCPGCRALLIRRYGYLVRENRLKAGACPDCRRAIPGVWSLDKPSAGSRQPSAET